MRETTADDMRDWARHAHGSPLYRELCEVVAGSDDLLSVINRISSWPRQNMLFAAVHYLLLQGADHDLARFYRSLDDEPEPIEAVAPAFRDFVLAHEEDIVRLGQTRYTQTNECRRCVALLPAIWLTGLTRFHLIDLGSSAGLNLLLDRYRYHWNGVDWGPESPVNLTTELRGRLPEPREIEVVSRIGLDLNPIDPNDPDERLWLDALIWPEHEERRRRLRAALKVARAADIRLVAGSALDTLGGTFDQLPANEPAVVINSFTLNQFTEEARDEVDRIVAQSRHGRPIARVAFEFRAREDRWPRISLDDGSGEVMIGEAHPHGEWVELW